MMLFQLKRVMQNRMKWHNNDIWKGDKALDGRRYDLLAWTQENNKITLRITGFLDFVHHPVF
jgi:hypothetical protein